MKIGLVSLGCPKNLVDSEVMLGLARQGGYELTADAADADVLVVNTCAFIDKAKQESIDTILEMAEHKKTGVCRRLVVTGCLAQRYRDELRQQIPEIDAVLGTGEVPEILEALDPGAGIADEHSGGADQGSGVTSRVIPLLRANGEPVRPGSRIPSPEPRVPGSESRIPSPESRVPGSESRIPSPESRVPRYLYDANTPRLLATPRHYAYVKIAEGCDYTCAFCIIPTLRGPYRSRPVESVVAEAERLAAQGVKELLLVSQDTTFYGVDRQDRGALPRLLRALSRVSGLEWIRLLYLYPTTIREDLLEVMAESDKVCKYIDLPLQHASDAVLRRMRRPGTRAGYERLLERIRRRVPGVALRTTLIVGFPGETADDYAELQEFVRSVAFDHLGVFTYSHEEGTSAHRLADSVPETVKRRRQAGLMRLQRRIVGQALRDRVGQRARVLVDGPSPEHELVLRGRVEGQAPEIDSIVYLTECDPSTLSAGQVVQAEIVGHRGYDLVARPLSEGEAT